MAKSSIAPLLVIVGETASGKTALSLTLAQQLNGEIISADSGTLRREANIGTAKPSKDEQVLVKHHMLDVIDACDRFTAANFKILAERAIEDISSRGKLPIMVGGTGLYVDSVIYNYGFLPKADEKLRLKLERLSIGQLLNIVRENGLTIKDGDGANKRRLVRLIETSGYKPERNELRPNTLLLGLRVDRDQLQQRLTDRIKLQLSEGLEEEVRAMSSKHGWDCEALKAIAYKEWKEYFLGAESREMVTSEIIKNSLKLAKKQRTWFKRNKSIHWFKTPVKSSTVVELITTYLGTEFSR